MSQKQQYKYFAFISYSSKDIAWGKRVQSKLENYRMPATLCNEHGWQRKPMKPIFFDKTDIQPNYLDQELQAHLKDSCHLIVICSPNSARSKNVSKEIAYFHSLGRTDNIHFFIVDGEPHSGDEETECFNPIIETLGIPEILGANIHEKVSRWPWINKERACVQLITKLLGIEFDSIWQRHKRMRIRKAVLCCVGLLLCMTAVFVAWKASQTVIQRNESRYIAEKALQLAEEGDVYLAKLLLLNTIPLNLEKPERPLIAESVSALAKIFDEEKGILKGIGFFRVEPIQFSPDGKTILTNSSAGTIDMWDVATGKCLRTWTLLDCKIKIYSPMYSPDGKTIVASCSDSTARIWNVKTGACIHTLNGHANSVYSARYSPDGKTIVTTAGDSTARIWDAKTGKQVCPPLKHQHWHVESAVYSPDGKTIVTTAGDSTARIWDAKTGKLICHPLKHQHWDVKSAVYSPDGKTIVTTAEDTTARIWDAKTGKCLHTLKAGRRFIVRPVVFSSDSKTIVTIDNDSTVRIWSVTTGDCLHTLKGHTGGVWSAIYSPDGKTIVSASDDGTIRVWDASTGICLHTLKGHTGGVWSAIYSPDGKTIVSASGDGTIRIWGVSNEEESWNPLPRSANWTRSSSGGHQGEMVVTNDGYSSKIWNGSTGECLCSLPTLIYSASYSPDGKKIVTTDYNSVTIWDALRGKPLKTKEILDSVYSVSYSPNGKTIKTVSYSPDGKTILVESVAGVVSIWDNSLENGWVLGGRFGYKANSASYSPDGKIIVATASDSTVGLWNTSNGKCFKIIKTKSYIFYARYSPDGKTILTNNCILYAPTYKNQSSIDLGGCFTQFSPDGKSIVSVSENAIKIIDVSTGVLLKTIPWKNKGSDIISASYSPDGKSIVAILKDGTVMTRKAPPSFQEMLEITRERFKNRKLTPEEKRRFYME